MTMTVPWLSLMIGLPILGAIIILCIRGSSADRLARTIALVVSLITFGLCVPLYCGFDPLQTSMQFQETHAWIAAYHIQYALGVDGLSLVFILLTQFIGLIVILAGCQAITDRVPQ